MLILANIIEVNGLSKSFGKVKAVNDISFYVEEGALFSFLGTNGAGKSTTISILLTLLQQDSGHVSVNGYTVGKHDQAIRQEIGVVFQESLLDPLLTVKENLAIRGSFYGMARQERNVAITRLWKSWIYTLFRIGLMGNCRVDNDGEWILRAPLFINQHFNFG